MTAPAPIKLVVGDDWEFPFAYKDANGLAINLSGFFVGGDILWPGGKIAMTPPGGTADLLDQSIEETRGKFKLTLDRSETIKVPVRKLGTHLRAFLVTAQGDIRSFPAWPLDVEER